MFVQKYIAPAFAVIGAVVAKSSASSAACGDVTINAQADADNLASCSTVSSITVTSNAVGTININGPQTVNGDFTCESAGSLVTLESPSISLINGSFHLFNLTFMSTLSFTELTSVGSIDWDTLTALNTMTFPAVVSEATNVTISNTFLTSLNGINLKTVGGLDINNNIRLATISTQVSMINGTLNLAANGPALDVEFPNLVTANTMTFRNISTLSIPSLKTVTNSLVFEGTSITSIFTPNLTSVGSIGQRTGFLTIDDNSAITNATFPLLKTVGASVQVADNNALQTLSFPALTQVGGAIDFSGNFTSPDLGALTNVQGTMNLQSQQTIDCTDFNKLHGSVVQGSVTCVSKTSDPVSSQGAGSGGSGTSTGSGSGSSGSKGAAMASYSLDSRALGLSVVGGLLGMLV